MPLSVHFAQTEALLSGFLAASSLAQAAGVLFPWIQFFPAIKVVFARFSLLLDQVELEEFWFEEPPLNFIEPDQPEEAPCIKVNENEMRICYAQMTDDIQNVSIESSELSEEEEDQVFKLSLPLVCLNGPAIYTISGDAGSGKSLVLQTLSRASNVEGAKIFRQGRVAFMPHEPMMANASIKFNILFGLPLFYPRLRAVITACALNEDLSSLMGGLEFQVGQAGSRLSGGQRQRVALARVLYSQRDIYLLDSPFSALDPKIKAVVMKRVLHYLRSALVVIATNEYISVPPSCRLTVSNGRLNVSAEPTESEVNNVISSYEGISDNFTLVQQFNFDETEVESSSEEPHRPKRASCDTLLMLLRFAGMFNCLLCVFLFLLSSSLGVFSDAWLSIWSSDRLGLGLTANIAIYVAGALGALLSLLFAMYSSVVASQRSARRFVARILEKSKILEFEYFQSRSVSTIVSDLQSAVSLVNMRQPLYFSWLVGPFVAFLGDAAISISSTPIMVPVIVIVFAYVFLLKCRHLEIMQLIVDAEIKEKRPVLELATSCLEHRKYIRDNDYSSGMFSLFCTQVDQRFKLSLTFDLVLSRTILLLELFGSLIATVLVIALNYSNRFLLGPLLVILIRRVMWMPRSLGKGFHGVFAMFGDFGVLLPMLQLLAWREEKIDNHVLLSGWPHSGRVEMKDVEVRYEKSLALRIPEIYLDPRDCVGVIGRTGAGKTTFVRLFSHLFNFEGAFLIDGMDVATVPLLQLRRSVFVMDQQANLLPGTLRHALDPRGEYSEDKILTALRRVDLHSPLEKNTSQMSKCEKQLSNLARILLVTPRLIILDEPTSAMDQEQEQNFFALLKSVQSTTVVVTHHRGPLQHCNKILLLSHGTVQYFGLPDDDVLSNGKILT